MGQARQRKEEIDQLKAQGTKKSPTDPILQAVRAVAATAHDQGVRLNSEMIFADSDVEWYSVLAQRLLSQGVTIQQIWRAQAQHDQMIRDQYGVDLAKFNGDFSLLLNYDPLSQQLGQLPAHIALEAAILNGITGWYSMRGHNPHFKMINMAV